ncbi:hypothetical protein CWI73_11705 [Idiomarina piscisalsi]|uniref:DUF5801 domain-containing protein n=1 Tax=Idiomarina piscisalsi TaxID=1096243 RepID=A0A432YII5_9GAMM|nr:hypothetical protein CWI73_11705 [Idiomarina piscisalsi]
MVVSSSDAAGNTVNSTATSTHTVISSGTTVALSENTIFDGNAVGEGTFTISGESDNLNLSLQGKNGLTSQGEPVQWSWDASSGTLTGHTGNIDEPVLTIELNSPTGGSNEWSYEVTLQEALDHPVPDVEDILSVPFEVVLDGEVAETIQIDVTDDSPTTETVPVTSVELENMPDVLLGEVSFTGSGSAQALERSGVTVTAKGFANDYNTDLEDDKVNLSSDGIGVDSGYSGPWWWPNPDEHGHPLENEVEYRMTDSGKGVSEQLIFDLGDKVAYGASIEFSKMYGGELETGVARFYRDGELIAEQHFTSDATSGDYAEYFNVQEGGFDQITIEATDNGNRSDSDNSDLTVKSITFTGAADEQAIASANGQIDYDAGADGLGELGLLSFDSDLYNGEGQRINVELDGANRLIGRVEGSDEIAFEVLLTPSNGKWEFYQYQTVQEPTGDGVVEFTYQVEDGDGDTAIGSFGIEPATVSAGVSIESVSAVTESGVDAIDAVWGVLMMPNLVLPVSLLIDSMRVRL